MSCILIVDDDPSVRTAVKKILRNEPYEIIEASNGREAVNLCRQYPIDVMITDLVMPKQEGIETIIEIRRDFQNIRIIAISGSANMYLRMAKEIGAEYVLSKPFSVSDLLNAVRKLMICDQTPKKVNAQIFDSPN